MLTISRWMFRPADGRACVAPWRRARPAGPGAGARIAGAWGAGRAGRRRLRWRRQRQHQRLGIVDGRASGRRCDDRQRLHPSAARVPAILEDREAELDLGVGQRFGGRTLRQRPADRRLTPSAPSHRLCGSRPSPAWPAAVKPVLARPDRLAGMLGVECGKPGMVVLIAGVAAGRHCAASRWRTIATMGSISLCGLGGRSGVAGTPGAAGGGLFTSGGVSGSGSRRARIERGGGGRLRCLTPCRRGKAAQHRHGKRDCER